jgi:putative MATE family efflux protein
MNLTEGKISKLILKIALPAGVGMMFHTFYNLIDTYWAGQLSAEGLAALSLSFVPFLLVISVGVGISQGTNALISNALGSKHPIKAKHYQQQALTLSLISSIILGFIGWQLSPWIFSVMGGKGEVLNLALEYINIIWIGAPFMILVQTLNSGLIAQGDTKTNRNALIVGFLVNIILDPLFLFGWGPMPALGIGGIAWATVLIQFVVMLYIAYKLYSSKLMEGCKLSEYKLSKEITPDILYQGAPASLSMMLVTVGVFIITSFVGRFGDFAIAAYGVAIRVEQIIFLPTIGLNMAALSLTGQNHGAGLKERVKETYFKSAKYGFLMMIAGSVLVYGFARLMMRLFTDELEVIRIGVEYLQIDALVLPAYALLFLSIGVLQGLKRPIFGLIINIFRLIAAPIIIFTLLVDYLGWGLIGVWWGIFTVTWLAALITVAYVIYTQKWYQSKKSS